ncbi:rhodanese-like domain-containing protein [Lishizhenia sp.]|uniref:rhodanese-like domain-containing protein n=1 Tax=Lishizhenia sp. TaxID=2497594 RepID=UPI00299EA194|nr:rhodanese-like domain-containing protein [Lishizhenia sp.]MDX1446227.1 rhodanese-like domain-containing protein [Lishizhenia sp.]
MKQALLILFSLIGVLVWGQNEIDPDFKTMIEKKYHFPTISQDSAQDLLDSNDVFFLDTREREEYNVSHLPGAIYTGYDNFSWSALKGIDTNAIVIVYCSIGVRSQNIAEKLAQKGYHNVYNLYGGIFLWADQARPMKDKSGKTTRKVHAYNKFWGRWVKKAPKVYEEE